MAQSSQGSGMVHLDGLRTKQLPATTSSTEELMPFMLAILQEAVPFIDSAAPKSGDDARVHWKPKGTKSHPDSTAPTEVSERALPQETWTCRRSLHEDKPVKGTASWDEFVRCFITEHAESEAAFTPAIAATNEALAWAAAGDVPAIEEGGVAWTDFQLRVEEMRHRMPAPLLKDRVFPVLQMSCVAAQGQKEFLFISIPVRDLGTASEAGKLTKAKDAQVGYYVSIERVRKLDDGNIEWLMATASDASGVIPIWVNNLAMPGVIWKDVPLFLSWIAKDRQNKGESKEETPVVTTGPDVSTAPELSTADSGRP